MKIETLPLSQITPYDRNPRRNDHAVDAVAASIREFGFKVPIVIDAAGVIVTGHTRYKAAQKLGLTEAPCIRADDLTPEQVRAFRLADNRVGELADWDEDLLAGELEALPDFEMEAFGFDLPEAPRGELQDVPMPDEAERRVQPGQIWRCGDHLVMCGDATRAEDVDALMGGERCDITFSSPPYNMNVYSDYESAPQKTMGAGKVYKNDDDNLDDKKYSDLISSAIKNGLLYTDDVLFNIGILGGTKTGLCQALYNHREKLCDIIVWNKSRSLPHGMKSQRGMLSHRCELIFCFNQKGSRAFSHPQWDIGQGINRIDTENGSNNEFSSIHKATFPLTFATKVLEQFTATSVLDLFGGSGTTMIAAEQLGRRARLMEIDPQYCDIILTRWEQFTGRKAERVS